MRLLKLGEAAEMIRISPATLKQRIAEGCGPAIVKTGGERSRAFIEEGELLRWIDRKTVRPGDEA